MKMYWKCGAMFVLAMMVGACALAMPATANGDDWGKGKWGKGKWGKGKWGKWDDDWYRGRGGYPYPVAYPVAYPVYAPASFGGDKGACYQACIYSGQYSPAQCGQWCYYA